MASNVAVTYNFTAGTPAVADDVDQNFTDVVNWINANAVHLDGSKAFSAIPSGPATDPTTANQLTRKAYVDAYALPSAWTAPTLVNSWVNNGAGHQNARYRKIGDVVYIEGSIKNGVLNGVIFTLPAGFRPPAIFRTAASDGGGIISIDTSGNVSLFAPSNTIASLALNFSTI